MSLLFLLIYTISIVGITYSFVSTIVKYPSTLLQIKSSFITGSRAYGIPREDSDIDLVILVEPDTACELWCINKLGRFPEDAHSFKISFNNLDLIICSTKKAFNNWHKGTELLKAKKPVTREEAIEQFESIFPKGKRHHYTQQYIKTPIMINVDEEKFRNILS